ncbi:MAG: hypothetical protein ABR520_04715 [Mycobacteriales bacterium]
MVIAGSALAISAAGSDESRAPQPVASPRSPAPAAPAALGVRAPELSLAERVRQATRIVVGRVTDVDRGTLTATNGEPSGEKYLIAAIEVTDPLKPDGDTSEVNAFTYDYDGAIVSSEVTPRPWQVGDKVLLFLTTDVGTPSERVQPPHLMVAEGESGRYFFSGDRLDAPFTLDDVRRAVRDGS